jgi:glycosyltransferase involved in cell wall biosynthesis
MPIVSIGMPVYNAENFVRDAIESLLNQTFEDFELIISDNASTDETENICQEYLKKDKRVRYHRNQKNIGAGENFNVAFNLSSGDYFKWAAHDDICAPEYLERCVEILDNDPITILCHSKTVLIGETGEKLAFDEAKDCFIDRNANFISKVDPQRKLNSNKSYERFSEILLKTSWCFEIFGLIRAAALKKTSLFQSFYGTDKAILAELSLIGKFAEINKPLFFRRCHAGQSTSIKSPSDRESWNNPSVQRGFLYSRIRCFVNYSKAIFQHQSKWSHNMLCLLSLARWLIDINGWKGLLSDFYREKLKMT